jgi:hypothetical protein
MGNPRLSTAQGNTDTWITPPFVIEALGPFDLDPCTPKVQPFPTAKARFTEEDDGLLQEWWGRVWLNPPYSQRLMSQFMAKLAKHNKGTALVFAKTETEMFFEHVWRAATGLLFIKSRLHFYLPDGTMAPHNAGAPSVLVAYGADDADVLAATPIEGQFVPLRISRGFLIDLASQPSWREALDAFLGQCDGPVHLSEIYAAFSSHPKAGPHYKEKIRQTLKRGRFKCVGRGVWSK